MSPRTKTITINLTAGIAAIVTVAGAVWGGGVRAVTFADHRYVQTDSFAAYQAGESKRHAVDSLNAAAEYHAIRAMLAGLDSSDRCRRNQTSYCR